MTKKRLFSGIRPTGEMHIGNYLGAIKNWVDIQDKYESYFSVADYHAITTHNAKEMPQAVRNMVIGILACGIDPEKSVLFVQSKVPQHTELSWLLGTVTNVNWLTGMIQFKEKSEKQAENVNAGLLCYPILQTADIALYKSNVVPVGEDQLQHIELARDVIRKFNYVYGDTLVEPTALITETKRIMGLDAVNKMSKSLNNYISISDSSSVIFDKLRPAVTDTARMRKSDAGTPEKCNVYMSYHKSFSDAETLKEVQDGCTNAKIGCIDCKKMLHRNMDIHLEPIRTRYNDLITRQDYVDDILTEGYKKARLIADKTIIEVKTAMGLE